MMELAKKLEEAGLRSKESEVYVPLLKNSPIGGGDLAKLLNINAKKAYSCLTVSLGKTVEDGKVIALKKGLLGKKEVKLPYRGKLVKYEEATGILVLEKEEVPALSEETEKKVEKSKTTSARGKKILEGEFGFGNAEGEIFYRADFALPQLNKVLEGKILVIKKKVKPVLLYRAAALGIKGIVCDLLDKDHKKELLDKQKSLWGLALLSLNFESNKEKLAKIRQGEKVVLEGKIKALYRT